MWKTIKQFNSGDKLVKNIVEQYALDSNEIYLADSTNTDSICFIDIEHPIILKDKSPFANELFFLPLVNGDSLTVSAEIAFYISAALNMGIKTDSGCYIVHMRL